MEIDLETLYDMVYDKFEWLYIVLMALTALLVVVIVFELVHSNILKEMKDDIRSLEDRVYGSRNKKD